MEKCDRDLRFMGIVFIDPDDLESQIEGEKDRANCRKDDRVGFPVEVVSPKIDAGGKAECKNDNEKTRTPWLFPKYIICHPGPDNRPVSRLDCPIGQSLYQQSASLFGLSRSRARPVLPPCDRVWLHISLGGARASLRDRLPVRRVRMSRALAASCRTKRIILSPHLEISPMRSISPDCHLRGVRPKCAPTTDSEQAHCQQFGSREALDRPRVSAGGARRDALPGRRFREAVLSDRRFGPLDRIQRGSLLVFMGSGRRSSDQQR